MSVNNQALDILHDVIAGRREAWDVLFALAKHNPAALVAACSPAQTFANNVLEAIRHGNRVGAIKMILEQFQCGLKEGKDLMDAAIAKLPDEAHATRVLLGGPIPF